MLVINESNLSKLHVERLVTKPSIPVISVNIYFEKEKEKEKKLELQSSRKPGCHKQVNLEALAERKRP